ncbi:MAG: caspase family protein [Leptolyngbyaceae cyanobacterium bins.302]|nr:caspase family protein [Leptolyngbyaceae cyanobacterium bins.302]
MASFWAIAVGIHQYQTLNPLPYAELDAKVFSQRLRFAAGVTQVYCLTDTSPDLILDGGACLSSSPTLANLKQFLQLRFSTPFLEPEDTLCFFFSGHGLQFAHQDYLMCADSDPTCAASTAIAVEDLVTCLRRSGTANIMLLLDACHTDFQKFGQGFGTDPKNVITLFSADFHQTSNAIPALRQGAFTHALLEGWQTLSQFENQHWGHLYQDLHDRLPDLNRRYHQSPQVPRLKVDPPLAIEAIPLPNLTATPTELPAPLVAQQLMQETTMKLSYW